MNIPRFSVIIPVRNGEKYLEQAIQSILDQTYGTVEILVVDGASTDHTVDIIKKYEDHIAWWISEPDRGLYDAINKGIQHAHGAWVGTLNSDDWFEPDMLDHINRAIEQNPNAEVIYGMRREWKDGIMRSITGPTHHLLGDNTINHEGNFIKRSTHEKYGFFSLDYRVVADYEMYLRLEQKGVPFVFVEKVLANFRLGGLSTRNNRWYYEKHRLQYRYKKISLKRRLALDLQLFLRNLFFSSKVNPRNGSETT